MKPQSDTLRDRIKASTNTGSNRLRSRSSPSRHPINVQLAKGKKPGAGPQAGQGRGARYQFPPEIVSPRASISISERRDLHGRETGVTMVTTRRSSRLRGDRQV